jgi:hypothetical protein
MHMSVAPGAAIPQDDEAVVKAIRAACNVSGTLARSAGLRWQVAVRNGTGQIYRSTTLHTRNQFARLATHLQRLGYMNELAEAQRPETGFDAIFSRTSPGAMP